MIIQCERCLEMITGEEPYHHRGQDLCEDCYMGAIEPPRTCDVAAVHTARKHRAAAGQTGTEGLLDLQKQIYEYIREEGKVTRRQLMEKFNLPDWELDKQIAVLRHCELVKGRKEGGAIYIVPFDR